MPSYTHYAFIVKIVKSNLSVDFTCWQNGCTADTLYCETLCCEMKSGCASSPIFQEKHSQLNAQSPLSVDHARQESGKRKTVVPESEMSVYESLGVMDRKYEIEYQKPKNKDSDLEHGSEIIKLCLTASLLNKVHYSSLWSKYIIWLQDSCQLPINLSCFDIVMSCDMSHKLRFHIYPFSILIIPLPVLNLFLLVN